VDQQRDRTAGLDDWVARGFISREQADRILAFERSRTRAGRRLPLAAEALGYLGVALALAAAAAWYFPSLDDLSRGGRIGVPLVLTGVLVAAGLPTRTHRDPALRRLSGVLWMLATATSIVGFEGLWIDRAGGSTDAGLLELGASVAAIAWLLYALSRRTPTLFAALIGTLLVVAGAAQWIERSGAAEFGPVFGIPALVVGSAWILGGRRGLLRSPDGAVAMGTAAALIAPLFMFDPDAGAALVVGSIVSAALLLATPWLHSELGLILAGLGLFGYLTGTIVHFFGETIGAPVALFTGGVLLMAIAVAVTRLRRFTEDDESGAGRDTPGDDVGELTPLP
jgi:hypothetical protein